MIILIYKEPRKQGFTLVELSIVIIIIGFLIAGIAAGQSLIKQAGLNSVITEFSSFHTALTSFENQYDYLPGDLPNASSYWPNCDSTPSNCNGNGDGTIVNTTSPTDEAARAWQQLTDSGILQGHYAGTIANYSAPVAGVEVPGSKFDSASGYLILFFGYMGQGSCATVGPGWCSGDTIAFGQGFANPNMSTTDAYNLDSKIDDGLPRQGVIWGNGASDPAGCYYAPNFNGSNYTGNTPSSYNISVEGKLCSLDLLINDLTDNN